MSKVTFTPIYMTLYCFKVFMIRKMNLDFKNKTVLVNSKLMKKNVWGNEIDV